MKKAVLYYNPRAGRSSLSCRQLDTLLERLFRVGVSAEAATSSSPEELEDVLKLEGKDLLLIYGGDGTLHSLLPAVVREKIPVALLPAGTANVLARELEIPRKLEKAIELLRTGRLRRIHLGQSQGKFFHLMVGVGLDGHIVSSTGDLLKRYLGVGAYWLAGLSHFWTVPLHAFEIELDGKPQQAGFAVISNCRYYGGQLGITPRASVFEDDLDVCVFTGTSRSRFLTYLYRILRGTHLSLPDVVYRKVSSVRVYGDERILVQMDGEVSGHPPLKITSYPPGIEILVPGGP
jgi:YegS/Rv2252/BmrU family lipid kinase